MIDFNDLDLKDLSDDQKKILDDLVKKIANWRCNNNIEQDRKLSNNEASQFTEWLQNKIIEKISFLPNDGKTLILYSGDSSTGTPLWQELKDGTFLEPVHIG